ncbi:MAG: hypothetical protein IME92_08640 [Proteobacteria bacterium]|nr:hypothetical protein [Pseudomonadota bacterium]
MYIIKPILDMVFVKNPVLILVFSFAILALATLLDGRTGPMSHNSASVIAKGPPVIVRIEDFSKDANAGLAGEMNLLAEIDQSDLFEIIVDKNGTAKSTKYIAPLYAATSALTKDSGTTNQNNTNDKVARKMLIGAIISDNANLYKQVLTLSDSNGQIGPIVKVNGLPAAFGNEYKALAQDNLAKLGIEYGYYGKNPIYIEAFFGNRTAILTEKTALGIQSDIIYIIAYILIAIAYYRSIVRIFAIVKGTDDPSIVNAIIKNVDKKSHKAPAVKAPVAKTTASDTKPPKPISRFSKATRGKSDPFSRLNPPEKPVVMSEKPTEAASDSVFIRQIRKKA